jgi:putative membrane protein
MLSTRSIRQALWTTAAVLIALPASAAQKPTEAQIFGILNAANTGEINEAQLAKTKSANPDVTTLADEMIKDHTKMNDDGSALAAKLGITPADSTESNKLRIDSSTQMTKLESKSGRDFDKAYVDATIKNHKDVLHLIDHTLLPAAKNPEITSMLKSARPIVQAHLEHAQHVQTLLKKGSPAATSNP